MLKIIILTILPLVPAFTADNRSMRLIGAVERGSMSGTRLPIGTTSVNSVETKFNPNMTSKSTFASGFNPGLVMTTAWASGIASQIGSVKGHSTAEAAKNQLELSKAISKKYSADVVANKADTVLINKIPGTFTSEMKGLTGPQKPDPAPTTKPLSTTGSSSVHKPAASTSGGSLSSNKQTVVKQSLAAKPGTSKTPQSAAKPK